MAGIPASLPAWECGLKSVEGTNGENSISVTPCVGVWIEILDQLKLSQIKKVTPCVGVWIEISEELIEFYDYAVTPCVGVWIEIQCRKKGGNEKMSLPAWECGLK